MKNATVMKYNAKALLESIETGATEPVSYINPKQYTQHNLQVADGISGFATALSELPKGSAKVAVKRIFCDGDYVFTHTEYNFFGPKVGFDIFRFKDGLITEHWDNLQTISSKTVSGRSQIDGPVEATDLDKTEKNKALIRGLIDDIFLGGHIDQITNYISTTTYAQHNPDVADGLDSLGQALAAMAQAGTPMRYIRSHLILGEGNFVLAVCEGLFLGKHVAFYDLFRVQDNKIVEHWDTIEEIPLYAEWKNSNGKFGFVESAGRPIEVIGRKWLAGFPDHNFKLDFHSETSMTWTAIGENGFHGDKMTVAIERIQIRPNVYMVTWGEPSLGATVVHIQDYENSQVWTNIVMTEGSKFYKMTGKLLPY